MKRGALIFLGGGVATVGAALLAWRRSSSVVEDVQQALEAPPTVDPATGVKTYPTVKVRATGYWPFAATDAERQMEGGLKDRRGKPLYTLEMAQSGKAPYVSVSGDDQVWPYGQRISIDAWPGLTFRVVDTGSHFRGAGKVYRVVGYEPLDVCVDSSKTVVPKLVTATVYPGDNFAGGKAISAANIRDQQVVGAIARGDYDELVSLLRGRRT